MGIVRDVAACVAEPFERGERWKLTLTCGHTAYRHKRGPRAQRDHKPPRSVKCRDCLAAGRTGPVPPVPPVPPPPPPPPPPPADGLRAYEAAVVVEAATGTQAVRVRAASPADALAAYRRGDFEIVAEDLSIDRVCPVDVDDFQPVEDDGA